MIKFLKLLGGAALALSLVGCGSKTSGYTPKEQKPVEPLVKKEGDDQLYMPMIEGSQWTYTLETTGFIADKMVGQNSVELVYRVTKSSTQGSVQSALLELLQGDRIVDRQDWQVKPEGLYQASAGPQRTPFFPAQIILKFPVTEGETFNWKGKGICPDGTVGSQDSTSKVLASQSVDTDMGSFSAVPVESSTTFNSQNRGSSVSTTWLRPSMGIVRYRQEVTVGNRRQVVTLRLKNYSLKKS